MRRVAGLINVSGMGEPPSQWREERTSRVVVLILAFSRAWRWRGVRGAVCPLWGPLLGLEVSGGTERAPAGGIDHPPAPSKQVNGRLVRRPWQHFPTTIDSHEADFESSASSALLPCLSQKGGSFHCASAKISANLEDDVPSGPENPPGSE